MKVELKTQSEIPKPNDLVVLQYLRPKTDKQFYALMGERKSSDCNGEYENFLFFTEDGSIEGIYRIFKDGNGLCIEDDEGELYKIIRIIPAKDIELREI